MSGSLAGSPYQGYLYSYPHKTAYRPLDPPRALSEAWRDEDRQRQLLYLHVPFCEHRCGFCNLFTTTRARTRVAPFLAAIEREGAAVARALEAAGGASYSALAIGGGTPTLLEPAALERLLALAREIGADPARLPTAIETSPETATPERLALLAQLGVSRVSIGVQSFDPDECRAIGRPQSEATLRRALDALTAADFAELNLDLIYGIPGQTEASWLASLEAALAYLPDELYLYPLYVRPLTGLGKRASAEPDPAWDAQRLRLYRLGRERLLDAGYRQRSMRAFSRAAPQAGDFPEFRCQLDGTVGLGPGARSYTRKLHYASAYAVRQAAVTGLVDRYLAERDVGWIRHGVVLDEREQRRRFALLGLLQADGLDLAAYRARFASEALEDLPALAELEPAGLAAREAQRLRLTADGLERSDAIGPWLVSSRVRELMRGYSAR